MASNIIYFNSRDELLRIDFQQIVYFEADGNYTGIVTANKLRNMVCKNLGQVEQFIARQLADDENVFLRIGKRYIVNTRYIHQISLHRQVLVLTDYERFAFQLSVSKEALKNLKELLLKVRL